MHVEPFRIAVTARTLDDLRERLVRARFPSAIRDAGWAYGTDRTFMRAPAIPMP